MLGHKDKLIPTQTMAWRLPERKVGGGAGAGRGWGEEEGKDGQARGDGGRVDWPVSSQRSVRVDVVL